MLIFTAYVAVRHRAYLLRYLLAAAPVAAGVHRLQLIRLSLPSFAVLSQLTWMAFCRATGGGWRGAGRKFDQPVARIVDLHSGFPIRDLEHASSEMVAPIAPWLAALALLHWIAMSAYVANWWAGQCYGPRFFTDLTPVFVLFLIPYFQQWTGLSAACESRSWHLR